MIKFKYNGRIYSPSNFEKKLKALGITENDVEIIEEEKKVELNTIEVHHFQNTITGYTITSIYADLSHLNYVDNIEQWIKLD